MFEQLLYLVPLFDCWIWLFIFSQFYFIIDTEQSVLFPSFVQVIHFFVNILVDMESQCSHFLVDNKALQ